jgi:hypothetical protein
MDGGGKSVDTNREKTWATTWQQKQEWQGQHFSHTIAGQVSVEANATEVETRSTSCSMRDRASLAAVSRCFRSVEPKGRGQAGK